MFFKTSTNVQTALMTVMPKLYVLIQTGPTNAPASPDTLETNYRENAAVTVTQSLSISERFCFIFSHLPS